MQCVPNTPLPIQKSPYNVTKGIESHLLNIYNGPNYALGTWVSAANITDEILCPHVFVGGNMLTGYICQSNSMFKNHWMLGK